MARAGVTMAPGIVIDIPPDDITVGDRFRHDYGDIEWLAEDIEVRGLLQPLVLSPTGKLIAGGRRLKAIQHLGWTTVPCYIFKGTSALEDMASEIAENFHRKDMSWQEVTLAVVKFHRSGQREFGAGARGERKDAGSTAWTSQDTADSLCVSPTQVKRYLTLAHFAVKFPEVLERDSVHAALQLIKRLREVEILEHIQLTRREGDDTPSLVSDVETLPDTDAPKTDGTKSPKRVDTAVEGEEDYDSATLVSQWGELIHGDAIKEVASLPSEHYACVVVDPPFGINLGEQVKSKVGQVYDDNPENFEILMEKLAPELYRVMEVHSHIYVFHSPSYSMWLIGLLETVGFKCDKIPWIWNKHGAAGQSNNPTRWPGRVYEPFIFAHKGQRAMRRPGRPNVINMPPLSGAEKRHPTEKPMELYQVLFSNSCDAGDRILDPTAGSGAALVAAAEDCLFYTGIEMDRGHYLRIKERVEEHRIYDYPERYR